MSDVRLYAEESEFERLSQNIVLRWKFTDITRAPVSFSCYLPVAYFSLIKVSHGVALLKLARFYLWREDVFHSTELRS
jgi:hypothetical protein